MVPCLETPSVGGNRVTVGRDNHKGPLLVAKLTSTQQSKEIGVRHAGK